MLKRGFVPLWIVLLTKLIKDLAQLIICLILHDMRWKLSALERLRNNKNHIFSDRLQVVHNELNEKFLGLVLVFDALPVDHCISPGRQFVQILQDVFQSLGNLVDEYQQFRIALILLAKNRHQ